MTTRRRRKSGSGPSALALIAWVGGTADGSERLAGNHWPGVPPVAPSSSGSRAFFAGRARGIAAGTLLACGSVLAVTGHAADISSQPPESLHPGLVTAGPNAGSGGYAVTSLAVNVVPTAAIPADVISAAAPEVASAQVFAGSGTQSVHRNSPVAFGVVDEPASAADLPVPITLPGTGRGQPAGSGLIEDATGGIEDAQGGLVSAGDVLERLDHLVAPVEEGTQPAMTMLSALSHS